MKINISFALDIFSYNLANLIIKRHVKTIHVGVRYPCGQCDYNFTDKGNFRKHVKSIHEGVRFPCDQCNYNAAYKGHLKKHKKSRHQQSHLFFIVIIVS